MYNRRTAAGFTLIELLVVIAIIAILAAILFPVFAKVREKGRQAACTSNAKQFMLAILQYAQDADEAMPIGFATDHSYGPWSSQYNAGGVGGTAFGQSGIQVEVQPYIKSTAVFQCPDDHPIRNVAEANKIGIPPGLPNNAIGHTYWETEGTSYKFTHQNFSNPFPDAQVALTGYHVPEATPADGKDIECRGSSTGVLDPVAQTYRDGAACTKTKGDATGYAVLTLADFARPSATRIYADFPKNFIDKPSVFFFHPIGTTIAYADGHVKFIFKDSDYEGATAGCDGVDWAWDTAGSCNIDNLQRNKD